MNKRNDYFIFAKSHIQYILYSVKPSITMSSFNPFLAKLLSLVKEKQVLSNLSVGEPFEPVPEIIKKSAINSIIEDKNKYSPAEGLKELRQLISQKVKEKNNIKVTEENIIITSGVSAGYDLALLSILNPGDEIILPDPYFATLFQTPLILNFQVQLAKTKEDFSLDIDSVEGKINTKTKALVINSPGNPTGSVYSKYALKKLAELADKHGLYVISDEIYEDFVYDGDHFSIGSIYEKTITMFGFSKSYSMTGWRLGYNVAPKEIVDRMTEVQRYLFYAPSSPVQYGALAFDQVDISEKIKSFDEKRKYVLDNLSSKYKINNKPTGAFYVYPELPQGLSGEEFSLKALENGVLVFPGSLFSQKDTNFRISYSTSLEELKKGVEILNSLI